MESKESEQNLAQDPVSTPSSENNSVPKPTPRSEPSTSSESFAYLELNRASSASKPSPQQIENKDLLFKASHALYTLTGDHIDPTCTDGWKFLKTYNKLKRRKAQWVLWPARKRAAEQLALISMKLDEFKDAHRRVVDMKFWEVADEYRACLISFKDRIQVREQEMDALRNSYGVSRGSDQENITA